MVREKPVLATFRVPLVPLKFFPDEAAKQAFELNVKDNTRSTCDEFGCDADFD